jgi:formate dehydrogenase subunit gamma
MAAHYSAPKSRIIMNALEDLITEIVARHGRHPEPARAALLPILHKLQAELGHVPEEAIRLIAAALNLTRAEVHGVVSFYHDFHSEKHALPVIKLCRAEACKARGVEALVDGAEQAAAGRATIEAVYCLGLCAVGPNAMVGDQVHARLDADRLAHIIGATA